MQEGLDVCLRDVSGAETFSVIIHRNKEPRMTISADDVRFAMRRWASGVVIVSAAHEDVMHGMTVSSFTSLSLTPPLIMVSLERSTRTHDLVDAAAAFGVTILAESQQDISDRCASVQTELGERFTGLDLFYLETGAPLIDGGLVFFDCRVTDRLDAGTHTVYVGEVVAVREGPQKPPLVYYNQAYRKLGN